MRKHGCSIWNYIRRHGDQEDVTEISCVGLGRKYYDAFHIKIYLYFSMYTLNVSKTLQILHTEMSYNKIVVNRLS